MLLYIHVPFCKSKCTYCSFFSVPLGSGTDGSTMRRYLDALLAEIAQWADRLGPVPVETIFFGGGTPSLLPAKVISAILDRIHKGFKVASNAEISMEANPDSFLEFGYAYELAATGVNRISLGVQSLQDDMLQRLGRPHTGRQAEAAFELARTAGFSNINLDLMWGLPAERERDWIRTLQAITRLQPEHLSCYCLTLEEGAPLTDALHAGIFELPLEKEQAKMYVNGAEFLESQGYLQYEISNFSRMGFQCRHNLGYWEGAEYVGFGPAATSTCRGRRWTNPSDINIWAEGVHNGKSGLNAERLTLREQVLETIMLRLRTTRGLRVKAYTELTGRDFMRDNKPLLHLLHGQGLVRIRNGYVSLTRTGMLVSNAILERLFEQVEAQILIVPNQ